MKFKMAENSLFAVLLRSPWWISIAIAAVVALLAGALLPAQYRLVGAVSALPFVVIGAMAARRQWRLPSAAQVSQTLQAVGQMAWPEFAQRLEVAFQRQGYMVQRGGTAAVDFELQRQGRRTLVCARRWKSARIGLEPLRALQAAREAEDASDALFIGLGELTDNARPFVAEHGIKVWQPADLAQALHVPRTAWWH
ncbi:MAG TPA: restriction endonuclease [Rubrivivax sp.]|nr:restriction endonuclease [Rubrivivax sp.]